MASEQGRSKFRDSSYIDKQEPPACAALRAEPTPVVLPSIWPSGFTPANPAALTHPGSFWMCFPASGPAHLTHPLSSQQALRERQTWFCDFSTSNQPMAPTALGWFLGLHPNGSCAITAHKSPLSSPESSFNTLGVGYYLALKPHTNMFSTGMLSLYYLFHTSSYYFSFFEKMEIYLIYNDALASGVQQSDSVLYT